MQALQIPLGSKSLHREQAQRLPQVQVGILEQEEKATLRLACGAQEARQGVMLIGETNEYKRINWNKDKGRMEDNI